MSSVKFVLDASVTLAWAFRDEQNAYTLGVLHALESCEAITPIIWPLEVGNGLVVAERRGRLTHAEALQFLDLLQELPITVETETPERIFSEIFPLAREYHLSTYDASYLDLAMRLGLPLATQDRALKQAAQSCGVRIFAAQEHKGNG